MRLFDLHCDTLSELLKTGGDIRQNDCQVDFERGTRFSPWFQCFAVWVRDGISPEQGSSLCRAMLLLASEWEEKHPDDFHILRRRQELFSAPKTPCTAILTIENGGVAAGQDTLPDSWIAAGVKMVSLTWNGANRWAQGCNGNPKRGLTAAGREAVCALDRAGILIDVSHLNRRSFWDLCHTSHRPLVASHTASAALRPIPRNLTNTQFVEIRNRGGLVGLDFCLEHIGIQSIDRFIAHLEHFWSLNGRKTVALGCDFDGISLPPEWNGMRILETLYERLLQRNYAESLIDDFFFDNAYRFFKTNLKDDENGLSKYPKQSSDLYRG